jgi:hypothetical protein
MDCHARRGDMIAQEGLARRPHSDVRPPPFNAWAIRGQHLAAAG